MNCRHCLTVELVPGEYIAPAYRLTDDFGGDFGKAGTTRTTGVSTGELKPCLKCPRCGHSVLVKEIAGS